MIPAILSCIFVIYLYQNLKAESANSLDEPVGDRFQVLTDRIADLNQRLSKLKRISGAGNAQ